MNDPQANQVRRFADTMLIVLFVGAISLPMLDMMFRFDSTPNAERRSLAPDPVFALNPQAMDALQKQIKDWTNDHFGLRNFMIRQHGLFKARLLGVSGSTKVIIGRTDPNATAPLAGQWLFLVALNTMNYHLHRWPMNDAQLEIWRKNLMLRRDWLAARGARYIFVIAPNAQTIYPEFLPVSVQRVANRTRADQLIEHIRKTTDIEVVDLRRPLLEAKLARPEERLFMRTDTHWNDLGCFRAYEYLIEKLRVHYPSIKPLRMDQFELVRTTTNGGDLAGMLGGRDIFLEDRIDLFPKPPLELRLSRDKSRENLLNATATDPDGVRLVMFRDSFAETMMGYLAEHFQTTCFKWTYNFHEDIILQEKPNLVITQMVERTLWYDITEEDWMLPAERKKAVRIGDFPDP